MPSFVSIRFKASIQRVENMLKLNIYAENHKIKFIFVSHLFVLLHTVSLTYQTGLKQMYAKYEGLQHSERGVNTEWDT